MDAEKSKKILKSFGKRLRELRLEVGLSQENLALNCDLDRSYVGQVERGEKNISLVNIYKIAKGLGVHPSEFLINPKRTAHVKEIRRNVS